MPGENVVFLKCDLKVDASVEECCAHNFSHKTWERKKDNDRKEVITQASNYSNNHSQDFCLVCDLGFGSRPRKFLTRHVWKRNDSKTMVLIGESITSSEVLPEKIQKLSYISANASYSAFYEELSNSSKSKVKSTKVKYMVQLNLGGAMHKQLVDRSAAHLIRSSNSMRDFYSKDYEFDLESREELLKTLKLNEKEHSEAENDDIKRAKVLLRCFENSEGKKVTLKLKSRNRAEAAAVQFQGEFWSKVSATVRCSGDDALAFLLNVDSRSLMSEFDVSESEIVDRKFWIDADKGMNNNKGGHHTRVVSMLKTKVLWDGTKVRNNATRRVVWRKIDSGNYIMFSSPTRLTTAATTAATTATKKTVRRRSSIFGDFWNKLVDPEITDKSVVATRITQFSTNETTIELIFDPMPKSFTLPSVLNSEKNSRLGPTVTHRPSGLKVRTRKRREMEFALRTNNEYRTLDRMQIIFQKWRALEGLDLTDGVAMGKMLMAGGSVLLNKKKAKTVALSRVNAFFEEFHAMKEMKERNPFFGEMVKSIIAGGEAAKNDIGNLSESKLSALLVVDGNYLGASFTKFLNAAATEEGAYNSWVKKFPAMNELSAQHQFFKPLMLTIGKETRTSVTWQKLILSIGAALMSLFDVASDVYTIAYYNNLSKHETANLMTIFVALSLLLQLLMVAAIHHKSKWRMLLEMICTITFTKPAFNKFRVLTDVTVGGHQTMSFLSEMMMFKMCEVFSECIPMAVIQAKNVLELKEIDWFVAGALFTSVVFVSEAVTYMTFMKDISEESRRTGKLFYGFVPLSGMRLVAVKWSMYLLSSCQLLGKSLEVVMLMQVGGTALAVGVLGGEMVVYLIYKIARGDFRYWLPLPKGASFALSILERVSVKVIHDFTGFLHARHPYEMGGFYWLFNMAWTQVSVLGAIKLKENFGYKDEPALQFRIFNDHYMFIANSLFVLWLVAITTLIFFSESGFGQTFYSLRTAKSYSKYLFDTCNDELRFQVFTDHRSYYAHFEDEIKMWLSDNWNDWHANRPSWLTESLIEMITMTLLPGGQDEGVLEELGAETKMAFSGARISLRESIGHLLYEQ